MFAIVVRFDLKDEAAARGFDALMGKTLVAIRDLEPGTLIYAVHRVEDSPLSRVFYELYSSRDAHAQHESTEHMVRAFAEMEHYVVNTRVEFLEAPSGKGV